MVISGVSQPEVDRIPFCRTEVSPDAVSAASRVLSSGWVTTGPEVAAFEEEFAAGIGVEEAVAVSSCTAAIEIALMSLRLPHGTRVLTSTMTFCGVVHAILHAGLRPVLVDVDPSTLMPNADTTAEAARRCGGAGAMVVLHFGGHPAPTQELAEAAGLPLEMVIEDAAHALGTWVGSRPVGTISAATCFSFYATKNLPIGEGGMITTKDPALADFARQARLHGMSRDAWKRYLPGNGWRYGVEVPGIKANMTDLQAAIGRAQLKELPRWQARREEIARRYQELLSGIPGLRLPPPPSVGVHAWHLYVARVTPQFGASRDELFDLLAERGIDCSVHFIPVHTMAYFRGLLDPSELDCYPAADEAISEILSLPMYPSLSDAQVDRIGEEIATIGGGGAKDGAAAIAAGTAFGGIRQR